MCISFEPQVYKSGGGGFVYACIAVLCVLNNLLPQIVFEAAAAAAAAASSKLGSPFYPFAVQTVSKRKNSRLRKA